MELDAGEIVTDSKEAFMTGVIQQHIRIDKAGVAWIDDTNIKVIEVTIDHLAYGWSPEEIAYQHANSLTLAQVHAALAHYFDYKNEFDELIQKRYEEAEQMRKSQLETTGRGKLRQLGLRP
jgi:uncharacterized protein (DUF433 family)